MYKKQTVRIWITALIVTGVLLTLLSTFFFPPPVILAFSKTSLNAADSPPELVWGPYLARTTATGTVINARTGLASTTTVEYATEAYYIAHNSYNRSTTDAVTTTLHHIPLTGLEPGATYHYRLTYDSATTGDYHFRTFLVSGPFTFIVYGDTQDELPNFSQYERYKLVADRVAAEPDVSFILHVGDQVNDGGDLDNWDRYFDVGRQLMANTTVYPALGNHEKNNALYYDAFGLSAYYSFDCAEAHFTVLDSINDTLAETAWLSNDLNTQKTWKFVSFHYPMYTSDPNHFGGWENLKSEWENTLITRGVDAVWNGHIHAYERYLENGIQYVVMGTGGGPLVQLSSTKYEGYQNSLENSLAYARITIEPQTGKATVQIIRVADVSSGSPAVIALDPPGTVYETFVLTKSPLWDLNNDHVCNIGDIALIGSHWGEVGIAGWIPEDLNCDGIINIGDIVAAGRYWGLTW